MGARRLAAASLICLLSPFSRGDYYPLTGEDVHQDCKADADRFCRDVVPGGGRILRCLKDHDFQLASACRKALSGKDSLGQDLDDAWKERSRYDFQSACTQDARVYCQGMSPGTGDITQCLKDHVSSLSPACRDALAK